MSLEIEYKNRTGGNGHWFDPETMGFFKSKIGRSRMIRNIIYFVSSEKPPHGDRKYSVRRMDKSGDITTVGPFCEYSSFKANQVLDELTS